MDSVRIQWWDSEGRMVRVDERPPNADPGLPLPTAEPEYPADGTTDGHGWTAVSGIYRVPSRAVRAIAHRFPGSPRVDGPPAGGEDALFQRARRALRESRVEPLGAVF